MHTEADGNAAVQKALAVMTFCGAIDSQAHRYHVILKSFHDVLTADAAKKSNGQGPRSAHEDRNVFDVLFGAEDASIAPTWGTSLQLASQVAGIMRGQGGGTQGASSSGMDELYSTGLDAKENSRLAGDLPGLSDEVIDFNGGWLSGVQDSFVSTDDVQNSLYGLIELV